MNTIPCARRLAGRLLLAAACGVGAGQVALAQDALHQVQKQGDVEYVSGGIGVEEAAVFNHAARDWPLALEFAMGRMALSPGDRAAFLADVDVQIERDGQRVLTARSSGPYMLLRVPPGRYTITAVHEGRQLVRNVRVMEGQPARTVLLWPLPQEGMPSARMPRAAAPVAAPAPAPAPLSMPAPQPSTVLPATR